MPTLRGYQRRWARKDVLAGLTAGTVVVPQAMAYATIAGLPVEIGLYTCMVPVVAYALLGGSRTLSVTTTSTIAVLVASTLASLPDRSAQDRLDDAFTLTVMVGVCLLAMRAFRLGGLIENISPATLTGIRFGVGLTVAASQLPALLGVGSDPDDTGFFARLGDTFSRLGDVSSTTVLVSVAALGFLVLQRRFAPLLPGQLVVVAAGIALVATTSVEDHGLELIAHVPTGLPGLSVPVLPDVLTLLPGALAIAVMAFLETVLVARQNRRPDEPPVDSDQELLAVGVASVAGGLAQSLPAAGGFSQTAVNLRAGARTQLSALTTAVLAVLVAIFLAPLLGDLPRSVLAAMVLMAVIGLLDPTDLYRFARIDRAELWVAAAVAALSLTGGMLLGVAVGVALTLVLVVRELNRSQARQAFPRIGGGWTTDPGAAAPIAPPGFDPAEILVLRLDGSIYTGNAQATVDAVVELTASTDVRAVVLDCSAARLVTVPMVDALRAMQEYLEKADVRLQLAEPSAEALEALRRSRWFAGVDAAGLVSASVDEAITAVHAMPVDAADPSPVQGEDRPRADHHDGG
jgi:sulfate permease, SulP family